MTRVSRVVRISPVVMIEYSRYVRDSISMGMMVRCCEGYEEVRLGDIGHVMKVSVHVQVPLLVALSGDPVKY